MWGVWSIAAECLAHPALLYPIWNTPAQENDQKKAKRARLAPKRPFLGAPEVLGGQRVARRGQYQVKVCGEHESDPGGPIRGSWDQIWSPGALRGPQKGHFVPKRALLGSLWTQKGSDTRSKCVVTMSPAQTGQSGAVGTKSGPPGPSEDLRGPQKGHSGPKRALLGAPGVP